MTTKWIRVRDRDGSEHRIRSDRITAYCGRVNSDSAFEIQFALFGLSVPYAVLIEDDVVLEENLTEIDKALSE